MGLSFGPKKIKKKTTKFISLLGTIFFIISLIIIILWWQKDNFLSDELTQLQQGVLNVTNTNPTPIPSPQVVLAYSAVVTLSSPAFTADFYLEDISHPQEPEWVGLGGRTNVETYTVTSGDTLWGIAKQFELELDTLRWSNPALEKNPDVLSTNTVLIILPVNGVYHQVKDGDTILSIAEQYGVGEADITNYPLNNLKLPYKLQIGDGLIIPNGRKQNITISAPNLDADYPFAWPLRGSITLGYQADHLGIDIGSIYGADVHAAKEGTVLYAQWAQTGYGFTIIIDHGNQQQSLYSHLKGVLVQQGDYVTRGQVIGAVGSTGNSTGPHVHFEIRQNEQRLNPLDYLKP